MGNTREPDANLIVDDLPADPDTERAFLGSALILPDVLESYQDAPEKLFTSEKHRVLWRTMIALFKAGEHVDRITIATKLHDNRQTDLVPLSYLQALDDAMALGSITGVEAYYDTLQAKAAARDKIVLLSAHIREIQLYGDSSETTEEFRGRLEQIEAGTKKHGKFRDVTEVILGAGGPEIFLQLQSQDAIATPFHQLNELFAGGLRPGEVTVLAARPSVGKTAAAMQFAQVAGHNGVTTGVFSLEMTTDALITRTACGIAGVDSNLVRNGQIMNRTAPGMAERAKALSAALGRMSTWPVFYDDTAATTLQSMRETLRDLMREKHVGLVVVDYLQLMGMAGRYENTNARVEALSRGLKLTAKEFKTHFLVLSQLSRQGDDNTRPTLRELRGSGAIEQDADNVIFLWPGQALPTAGVRPITMILEKQRNGPTGDIELDFLRQQTRFVEAQRINRTMAA